MVYDHWEYLFVKKIKKKKKLYFKFFKVTLLI